jgi:hypothetical protein
MDKTPQRRIASEIVGDNSSIIIERNLVTDLCTITEIFNSKDHKTLTFNIPLNSLKELVNYKDNSMQEITVKEKLEETKGQPVSLTITTTEEDKQLVQLLSESCCIPFLNMLLIYKKHSEKMQDDSITLLCEEMSILLLKTMSNSILDKLNINLRMSGSFEK